MTGAVNADEPGRLRTTPGALKRTTATGVVGVVLFLLPLFLTGAWQRSLSFGFAGTARPNVLSGFYGNEVAPDGRAFVWTGRTAELRLDGLDRRIPWTVHLRTQGMRPAGTPHPTLTVFVGASMLRRWVMSGGPEGTTLEIPSASHRGLRLTLSVAPTFVPGPSDPRELGVVVYGLELVPHGLPLPPADRVVPAACAGLAFGIAAGLAGLGLLSVPLLLLLGVAQALAAFTGAAALTNYSWTPAGLAVSGVAALTVWLAASGRRRSQADVLAGLLAVLFVYLKVLLLLHPDMTQGDTVFHLNRFKLVWTGVYFFTSVAPGGEFPYPVALYVIASWLRPFTSDVILLLRLIPMVVDAAAGLALYVAVKHGWKSCPAGLLALAFYQLVPAAFQVHAVAYLTNALGASAAAIVLGLTAGPYLSLATAIPLLAFTLVAFLAHTGTFLFLAVALLFIGALLSFAPRALDSRHAGRIVLFVLAGAFCASTLVYYGHFGPTYVKLLSAKSAPSAVGPSPSIPVQRVEAHQTKWVPGWVPLRNRLLAVPGYLRKYLGWSLIALAVLGFARLRTAGRRTRFKTAIVGWLTACLVFWVLGQLTPIDVRYYLAMAPAVAVLAALEAASVERGRPLRSALAILLTGAFVWQSVAYWLAWFSPTLPR